MNQMKVLCCCCFIYFLFFRYFVFPVNYFSFVLFLFFRFHYVFLHFAVFPRFWVCNFCDPHFLYVSRYSDCVDIPIPSCFSGATAGVRAPPAPSGDGVPRVPGSLHVRGKLGRSTERRRRRRRRRRGRGGSVVFEPACVRHYGEKTFPVPFLYSVTVCPFRRFLFTTPDGSIRTVVSPYLSVNALYIYGHSDLKGNTRLSTDHLQIIPAVHDLALSFRVDRYTDS